MHSPDELLEAYDRRDRAMRSSLSVPEVEAYSTLMFEKIGWPHSVIRAADLVRYVDWAYTPGADGYFDRDAYLPTQCASLEFTGAEAALLRRLSDATAAMTRALGRETRPVLNHLAQIGPFRIIMELGRRLGRERLTVFDVGAGSGYQAALHALAGNRVLLTDNAQALFLFQSLLMRACCEGARNWVTDGRPDSLDEPAHMVPWWEYLALRHGSITDVDVIFCNNNLGEMNYNAAAYTIHLAKRLMAASPVKLFFYTCLGTPQHANPDMIDALFKRAGFVNVIAQPFWLYTPEGHKLPADLVSFFNDIPRWGARLLERRHTVRDLIDATPATLPMELDFAAFIGNFDLSRHLKP
jgi:hypothetical protein